MSHSLEQVVVGVLPPLLVLSPVAPRSYLNSIACNSGHTLATASNVWSNQVRVVNESETTVGSETLSEPLTSTHTHTYSKVLWRWVHDEAASVDTLGAVATTLPTCRRPRVLGDSHWTQAAVELRCPLGI